MKAAIAFLFFMLFLAGIAFVNLSTMQSGGDRAAGLQDLQASAWRPDRLNGMALDDESDLRLEFSADGQVAGYAGCNRFFGEYVLDAASLTLGPLGATRRACPEPAGSMEIAFLDALQSVRRVELVDQRLVLSNDTGTEVLRLAATARISGDSTTP